MSLLDTQTRVRHSLDGEWAFLVDPDGSGAQRGLQDPDSDWPADEVKTVTVPHVWQEAEEYREYTGTAWYRTTIEFDDAGDRTFLHFGAVDYEATVYVNGIAVGTHRGGYLPFEVEMTNAIESGENVVVVEVTDPADLTEISHGKQGKPWYTRVSGIWQSVTLESRPEAFITGVKVTPDLDDDSVAFAVDIDGERDASADITVTKDGDTVSTTTCDLSGGTGECTVTLSDPDYWTPSEPELYDVTASLRIDGGIVDEHKDYFGMRSVSHDGEQLYLNGEPLYIRGALDQAYYPETLYRPFEADLFEKEIRIAKDLGFNMLRKHIKPAHPDFVEAADRLGILVWEEPANPDLFTERSKREVREQMRGLIERDYNRPSVVAWSIYNEEWGIGLDQVDYSDHPGRLWNDEEKQAHLTDLFHEVDEWDPTRLVCDNSGWAHVATDINDYHEYYVSPDRAAAWEDGLDHILDNPGENYAVENTSAEDVPILISEFGTWGLGDVEKLRDHYNGDPSWFSHDFLDDPLKRPEGFDDRYEATNLPDIFDGYGDLADTWQQREAASLKDVIETMRTRDGVAGYVVTEFSDIEWEFNGILDYFREPKSFVDVFATVNDDLLVVVEPDSHVVAAGETVTVDVSVVNDTNKPLDGTLRWNGLAESGSQPVYADGFGTTTVAEGLTIAAPPDASTGERSVTVTFETDDRTVSNSESLTVVQPEGAGDAAVFAEGPIASRLDASDTTLAESLEEADIAFVESMDADVEAFVERGNAAVLVPGEDGRMADDSVFEYRSLPAGESWNLVAALPYQDSDLVDDLCPGARIGWAFEDLFPHDLAEGLDASADDIHVGSVEGWIANWGSPLVVRDLGDGQICSCTFRVADAYGEHPTATLLVNRLIENA